MKRIAKWLLAAVTVTLAVCLMDFVAINWLTNCQSWDREQWTGESSCVTPGDVWAAVRGKE